MTLDPRPDTETLVEAALAPGCASKRSDGRHRHWTILDLGHRFGMHFAQPNGRAAARPSGLSASISVSSRVELSPRSNCRIALVSRDREPISSATSWL